MLPDIVEYIYAIALSTTVNSRMGIFFRSKTTAIHTLYDLINEGEDDIVILPPLEDGNDSAEDSGNEDEGGLVDNLSSKYTSSKSNFACTYQIMSI